MSQLTHSLIVHLPDTRVVELSRYGCGNLKLGAGVFTYSRIAGSPAFTAGGTCPGSTTECEAICYAKRIGGIVKREVYAHNGGDDVPTIPDACRLLRIHVSGDFDTVAYIDAWIARLKARPDVTAWAYTRSWRVPALLTHLEILRALPNVQLFASMDRSHADVPPTSCAACYMLRDNEQHLAACPDDGGAHDYRPAVPWRRAWIDGDSRGGIIVNLPAHGDAADGPGKAFDRFAGLTPRITYDGTASYVCPEETKHKRDCVDCGYCFEGARNDVTFLRH